MGRVAAASEGSKAARALNEGTHAALAVRTRPRIHREAAAVMTQEEFTFRHHEYNEFQGPHFDPLDP